jgi:hypothetical protein
MPRHICDVDHADEAGAVDDRQVPEPAVHHRLGCVADARGCIVHRADVMRPGVNERGPAFPAPANTFGQPCDLAAFGTDDE